MTAVGTAGVQLTFSSKRRGRTDRLVSQWDCEGLYKRLGAQRRVQLILLKVRSRGKPYP